jgi:hypothetical protein
MARGHAIASSDDQFGIGNPTSNSGLPSAPLAQHRSADDDNNNNNTDANVSFRL